MFKKNVQETLLKSCLRGTGKNGQSDYCSTVVGWCITLIQTKISFKDWQLVKSLSQGQIFYELFDLFIILVQVTCTSFTCKCFNAQMLFMINNVLEKRGKKGRNTKVSWATVIPLRLPGSPGTGPAPLPYLASAGRDHSKVSWDAVSPFDLHQISQHHKVCIDLHLLPLPDHHRLLAWRKKEEQGEGVWGRENVWEQREDLVRWGERSDIKRREARGYGGM